MAYDRILDLSRLEVWPERYLESLAAHGQWTPLDNPVPANCLLGKPRVATLRADELPAHTDSA